MTVCLTLLSLLLAAGAQAQIVLGAEPSGGDVSVDVGSASAVDVGVRYWVGDGVTLGARWSASAFDDAGPAAGALEVDARTVVVGLETDWLVLGDRFTYASGVQAFNRRQVNALEGSGSAAREVDVWGGGLTTRFDLRLVGPVHVGHQGGLLGLRLVRTRGEPASRGAAGLEDETTRLKLGGPGRFYVAVRL